MSFQADNVRRLERGVTQCLEVLDVPRRLGADATDKELADDKRCARRIKHRIVNALGEWGALVDGECSGLPPDGTGARMRWEDWWIAWRDHADELRQQAEDRSDQHKIDRELEGIASVLSDLRT